MLQPRVGLERCFAPVPVIVQQLFAGFDVAGRDQDEVGDALDVVELRLTVAAFAVVDQPAKAVCLLCRVNAVGEGREGREAISQGANGYRVLPPHPHPARMGSAVAYSSVS